MADPTPIPIPRKPVIVSALATMLRDHGITIAAFAAAAGIIAACLSMQGCDPGDYVTVPTPIAIQQTIPGTPPTVTLNQSHALREQYEWVQGEAARAESQRAAKAAAAIEESKRKITNDLLNFTASMQTQIEAKQRETALAMDGLTGAAQTVANDLADRLKSLQESTNRELTRFDNAILSGQQKADVFASMLSLGLDTVAGALQTAAPASGPFAPIAGAGVLGLGMLGTLFIPRPGTQRRIDSTWDEAFEAGRLAAAGTAIALPIPPSSRPLATSAAAAAGPVTTPGT